MALAIAALSSLNKEPVERITVGKNKRHANDKLKAYRDRTPELDPLGIY